MIDVSEVVVDTDMIAPQPFTILRSQGAWVAGGFQSTTFPLTQFGPVQQATNKEIMMLPEADRVGAIRSFWATVPIYVTRGTAAVPSTHGEVPSGTIPGTAYALSAAPPGESGVFYVNGVQQTPGVDYTLAGAAITTLVPTPALAKLYFTWPITAQVGAAASDIIQYGAEQYRVISVFRVPGSGYWKALGSRLNAA